MTIWLDAQLSPKLATWISDEMGIKTLSVRELLLSSKTDREIFFQARGQSGVIIMSKDSDFIDLVNQYGPPPKFIWIRSGNTSNEFIKKTLIKTLPIALDLLQKTESIVEISD
ncbi:hypothetical protein EFP84_08175 [Leptospira kmetyi]|uniref:DUF5615 domain-containing protein n=1 Tax=Leptospira kmetyi TaxID=408139 RepID=A0AAD0XPR9_9LEPT|nr:hypothetical protein EFP84_08175 [Leptospira kmetyi]